MEVLIQGIQLKLMLERFRHVTKNHNDGGSYCKFEEEEGKREEKVR